MEKKEGEKEKYGTIFIPFLQFSVYTTSIVKRVRNEERKTSSTLLPYFFFVLFVHVWCSIFSFWFSLLMIKYSIQF